MKKIAIAAALFAAFTSTAFAQTSRDRADPFAGFSLGVLVNSNKANYEYWSPTAHATSSSTTSNVAVQGQYNWRLSGSAYVAVGATTALTAPNYGNVDGKDIASLYIAPGYAVAENTLLYAKLGSSAVRLQGAARSASMEGSAFGVGFQQHMGNGLSVQLEYMAHQFTDRAVPVFNGTDRFKAGVLSAGLNYRF